MGYGIYNFPATFSNPTIYGSSIVGSTLSAGIYAYDYDTYYSSNVAFGWYSYNGYTYSFVGSGYQYLVNTSDIGKQLFFKVSFYDNYYNYEESIYYGNYQTVTSPNFAAVFSNATVTGKSLVGETISAGISYSDANGAPDSSKVVFYWYRYENGSYTPITQ
jgi:hypothetical protein